MPVVIFDTTTIGDVIFAEPALRNLASASGEMVNLWTPSVADSLYAGHPCITVCADRPEKSDYSLNALAAYQFGMEHCVSFLDGFYHQVGLSYSSFCDEDRMYGFPWANRNVPKEDFLVIAPHSANCSSHFGGLRDKTISDEWWAELVDRIGERVVQVDGAGANIISGAEAFLGRPMTDVVDLLERSKAMITVDNGASHIGYMTTTTIALTSLVPWWIVIPPIKQKFCAIQSSIPPKWNHDTVIRELRLLLNSL